MTDSGIRRATHVRTYVRAVELRTYVHSQPVLTPFCVWTPAPAVPVPDLTFG